MSVAETNAERRYARIESDLISELRQRSFQRQRVRFLLGTDEGIGFETRVALVPQHLETLREDLERCGLEPQLEMISGAGTRAGFDDEAYRAVGVKVLRQSEAESASPYDVVHALKEPTDYESRLPGPFLRLGALHLASKPPGVCRMLASRSFAAIIDGGTVGYCSYHQTGGDRTPIVGSMSRFAGAVAGEKLLEGLAEAGRSGGRVVVVGGGIAGMSAIRQLQPTEAIELIVIEPVPAARERFLSKIGTGAFARFQFSDSLETEQLNGAVGVVFAHRSGASAAEKVCNWEQIQTMAPGAAIIDIAIDQGGSILHPGYDERDDASASLFKYRQLFANRYFYYAETNMPRERPEAASLLHGDSSLPYLTLLLGLAAAHGGGQGAAQALLALKPRSFRSPAEQAEVRDMPLLLSLEHDLRNGLQLAVVEDKVSVEHPDIESNHHLKRWVLDCASS